MGRLRIFSFLLFSYESNKEYSGSCGWNIDLGGYASVAMQIVLVGRQLASIMKSAMSCCVSAEGFEEKVLDWKGWEKYDLR